MNILIVGGDGYTGWPLALRLSNAGHQITIIDDFRRRKIDDETGSRSLTPIATLRERLEAWEEVSNKKIDFRYISVDRNFHDLLELFKEKKFDTVVHLAEQKSAPYSMKSSWHRSETMSQNISSTQNILEAIIESNSDTHFVHLGTMGVYGYGSIDAPVPEGYLKVKIQDYVGDWNEQEILYPPNPGSVYHLTKCLDHLVLAFYLKNYNITATDLHQGIVWGTETEETSRHAKLINRFDYDGEYGTVLNRFLIQGSTGMPLSIYGTGGQSRALIHLKDSIECIKLAIENPPSKKDRRIRVFNQAAETKSVLELAQAVSKLTDCEIHYHSNPRAELSENKLIIENAGLKNLGWAPKFIDDSLLLELNNIAIKFSDRIVKSSMSPLTTWRSDIELDKVGKNSSEIKE